MTFPSLSLYSQNNFLNCSLLFFFSFTTNNRIAASRVSLRVIYGFSERTVIAKPERNLINSELELVTVLRVLICSSGSVSSIFRVLTADCCQHEQPVDSVVFAAVHPSSS